MIIVKYCWFDFFVLMAYQQSWLFNTKAILVEEQQ